MHRINTDTALVAPPALVGSGATQGWFTDGDPTTGVPPTGLDDTWFNSVQDEISNVILGAPNPAALSVVDNTQLLTAIKSISKTPFWRTREYCDHSIGAVDATYFKDAGGTPGINFPAGAIQGYYTRYPIGPGGGWVCETPGLGLAIWLRMGLENVTGADITANWILYAVDNYGSVIWDGTTLVTNPTGDIHPSYGTFTIPAGTSKILELFFDNNAGSYDPSNQGEFHFMMDALDQAGVVWVDAGR